MQAHHPALNELENLAPLDKHLNPPPSEGQGEVSNPPPSEGLGEAPSSAYSEVPSIPFTTGISHCARLSWSSAI